MPHSPVNDLAICINARRGGAGPGLVLNAQFGGLAVMHTHMETENGALLLLRLNWDRALCATLIFLSLCLGSWLVSL